MLRDEILKQLRSVPLFSELRQDDLRATADLLKRERYKAGRDVCRQGRLGQTAYLIEEGEARVLHIDADGVQHEVGRLGPGAFFGETSLLLGEPRDATVQAVRDLSVLSLDRSAFDPLLNERPWMLKALQLRPDVAHKRSAKRFKWQDPDEVTIVHLHKHKMVLVRHMAFPLFVLLVVLLGCSTWYLHSGNPMAVTVGLLLGLVPFVFILYLYLDHENDNYVVTNKRVVHEERVFIFRESRVEAPLRAVQDIQESQEGLLAQLYNFGDLIIETAGERGHVVFHEIPNPERTRDLIFEQIRRVRASARAEEQAAIRDAMAHHFGLKPEEEQAAPQEPPAAKWRFRLRAPGWLLSPVRLFRYFVPPLRQEHRDAVTWRKHWVALLGPISLPTVLIVVATIVAVFYVQRDPGNWAQILVGYGTVIVFLFPWWLWKFDDWQNDIYQVTSTRIIDVERLPFYLREQRREASLGVIQNIGLEIPGFIGKLLNYGSVTIETAGAGAFTFDQVKDPRGVQAEIFRRVEAFQQSLRRQEAMRHRSELMDWFSVYHGLHQEASHATRPLSPHEQEP